jgi:hypothetical protein
MQAPIAFKKLTTPRSIIGPYSLIPLISSPLLSRSPALRTQIQALVTGLKSPMSSTKPSQIGIANRLEKDGFTISIPTLEMVNLL